MVEQKAQPPPQKSAPAPAPEPGAAAPAAKQPELRHLVRIAAADIDGRKSVMFGLRKVKGVGLMLSNAVCRVSGIDALRKIGALSDSEVKKLGAILADPAKAGIPTWMFNHRRDRETNEDKHLVGTPLTLAKESGLRRIKKIKSYKGIRHMTGRPVRGQRTRSNFRANKGKVHLGVRMSSASRKGKKT